MRRALLVLGVLVMGAGGAWAGAKKMKRVEGRAERHASICGGGAAIRDEDLAQLPPPQPLGGMEFLVVAGGQITGGKPAARFVTRADGTFVTRLPAGTWCFFEAGRRPEPEQAAPGPAVPPSARIDGDCLAEQKRRCDLVLPVKSDVRAIRIVFTQQCPQPWAQPCYHGPMPP